MSENGNRRDPLGLPPPNFQLPDDMDDYELWTVRLPTSLDISTLRGVELQLPQQNVSMLGKFKDTNHEYGFTAGHAVENEQFRLLSQQDGVLRLCDRPFDRHINVVDAACLQEIAETELAPRLETAPVPVGPIRRSYSHIPQASGLKRRWMPPGGVPTVDSSKSKQKTQPNSPAKLNGVRSKEDPTTPETTSRKKQKVAFSTPASGTANDSRGSDSSSSDEPESKRVKHEEISMNGEDSKSSKKKSKKEKKSEKKAARKAEKKAKKERKREKKEKMIKYES